MYQDDYIIAFDENGQPYIAHAGWLDNAKNAVTNAAQQVVNKAKGVGRGVRQNHKYILKVIENGKARYFYKQEEVKAYYEAKKRGIKNAAEYAQNAVKDKASDVADAVKNTAANAKGAIREATGQAARDRMDEAANHRDNAALNMRNTNIRRQKAENDKAIATQERAEALSDIQNARTAQRGLQQKIDKDTDRINTVDRKKNTDEHTRLANSLILSQRALDTQRQKEMDGYRRENSSANKISAAKKEIDSAISEHKTARNDYREAENEYNKNKATYDKSLAGAVDRTAARARDVASDAREAASSAFNKAKDAANNTVNNAKNTYERMKSEFRDKAEQAGNAVRSTAKNVVDKAKDIAGYDERERFDQAIKDFNDASTKSYDLLKKVNQAGREYRKTPLGVADSIDQAAYSAKVGAQSMIDKARTAVKDKSEDLSAKAKSTVQSARDSVNGMIDNARSSTAKAVNEAWDKIPKNADGTVNPFDKNFQSTYNDWKTKKDTYDSSLAGRAKDAAEKATDSVQDMIDKAKKAVKGNSGSANARATKSSYGEYSDNDKDFAEKNYSNKNHVEDTDFYTFKRDDGKWVILEEDMKWVLPEGVTGNDPGVRNALKQFADYASSAKAIGNANYNADQWVDAVTDAIDKAAEKQQKR